MLTILTVLACTADLPLAWFDQNGEQATPGEALEYEDPNGYLWGIQDYDGRIVCLYGQWYLDQVGDVAVWPEAPPLWVVCSVFENAYIARSPGSVLTPSPAGDLISVEDILILDDLPEWSPWEPPLELRPVRL